VRPPFPWPPPHGPARGGGSWRPRAMADPGGHRDKRAKAGPVQDFGVKMDDSMLKKCDALLKNLLKRNTAAVFSAPVDWRALNLPDYPKLIKQPMDLGTVQEKLTHKDYKLLEDFSNDVRLVWKNAMVFNGADSVYFKNAKQLCDVAEKKLAELEQEGAALMPAIEPLLRCELILSELMRNPLSEWFLHPVDVDGLGLHDYRTVISKPMDLSTVQRLLKGEKYETVEAFAADVKLVFDNCIAYNGATSMFGVIAGIMSGIFDRKAALLTAAAQQAPPPRLGQPVPDREGWPTFQQKKKFYDACTKLTLVELNHIVKLVHRSCAAALQHNGDKEVELDVDGLDMDTFNKVLKYAKQCTNRNEAAAAPNPAP